MWPACGKTHAALPKRNAGELTANQPRYPIDDSSSPPAAPPAACPTLRGTQHGPCGRAPTTPALQPSIRPFAPPTHKLPPWEKTRERGKKMCSLTVLPLHRYAENGAENPGFKLSNRPHVQAPRWPALPLRSAAWYRWPFTHRQACPPDHFKPARPQE